MKRFFSLVAVSLTVSCASSNSTTSISKSANFITPPRLGKTVESCHAFVQNFYDWYLPVLLLPKPKEPAFIEALTHRPTQFAQSLIELLKNDYAAQKASDEGVVGLESDPFLNAQDPANHYALGAATLSGETCSVDIQSDDPSVAKSVKPDVTAQLRFGKSGWEFVNFLNPNWDRAPNDLVSQLVMLKQDREARALARKAQPRKIKTRRKRN